MSGVKISAVIITFNEEKNIARCIESLLPVADEIVVLDSFSTDGTKQICERYPVKFFSQDFAGYGQQKNDALELASFDYVLSIDADEALSPDLASSIAHTKKNLDQDAFIVNRLTNFCGSWIRHCGWYPDKRIRLWNRRKGEWRMKSIHETVKMHEGVSVGQLQGDLLHYSFPSLTDYIGQLNNFSSIAAEEAFKRGKKVYPIIHIVLYPFATFFRMYFLRLGMLDGLAGFMVCVSASYYRFVKYSKLYYLKKQLVNDTDGDDQNPNSGTHAVVRDEVIP